MKKAFENSANSHALGVIHDFFDCYGLHYAVCDTSKMIQYAMSTSAYKGRCPYSQVHLADWLRKLVAACFTLQKEWLLQTAFEVAAGEQEIPDLSRLHDFAPAGFRTAWPYLPRHLTAKQYLNPIFALKKLRKYQSRSQWNETIDGLMEYALTTSVMNESLDPHDMIKLRSTLLQAIEAGYLILVRYEQQLQAEPSLTENQTA